MKSNSELRLDAILNTVVDGIITIDSKGIIQTLNQSVTRLFGYDSEELIGQNIKILMPAEYASKHDEYLERYRQTNQGNIIGVGRQVVAKRKDGSVFPMHLSVGEMLVKGEKQFTGVIRDISDLTGSFNEALQFKEALDKTLDMIFMFNLSDYRFIYANKGAVQSMEYEFDELMQMYPYDIKPEITESEFKEMVKPLISGEEAILQFETIHRTKTGKDFPVAISLQLIRTNTGDDRFVAIIHDITERRNIEIIKDQSLQFKEALDNTLDMIFMFNLSDYRFIYANKGAVKSMEYEFDELMQMHAYDIKPEITESQFKEMVKPLITGEKATLQFETFHRTKAGKDFPVAISLQLIRTKTAEDRFVAIVHDITERRKAENLKKEFVSTVSHELRTPLTSIRGSLSLVLSKVKAQKLLPEKLEKMLSLAERNSERLTLLINDILDLEKIESGKMAFNLKKEEIYQVAQKACEDNKGYANKHKITINLTKGHQPIYVNIDEHRILQVFSNLISNAIKFSKPGGNVSIQIQPIDNKVKVSVIDQGRGIPEEFKKTIFNKFTQADSSDSREKGGTGLGLSISQAIMENHNGEIGFESEEGRGTEFYFILDQQLTDDIEPINERESSGTVLICEDNEDIAGIYQQFLHDKNYNSVVVDSVKHAKEAIKSTTFSLIILDLELYNSNGMEILNDSNIKEVLEDTPIIVISGHIPNNLSAKNNLQLKVMDWSEKPLNMDRLSKNLHKIEGVFNKPNILHVEDDPDLLQLTSMLLENWTSYRYAKTIKEARSLLETFTPDLVLLDLNLTDGFGKELIPELKAQSIPIIIFTGEPPDHDNKTTVQVDDILIKSVTQNNDLINAIKKQLSII